MACDYFIDALDDPDFALKVRERSPKDLDSALRVALQLAVCLGMSSRAADGSAGLGNNGTRKLQNQLTELPKKRPDNGAQQASRRAGSSTDRGKELDNDRSRSRS